MSYYVTNENSVLNINNAHLKVSGNIQTDVMKLGAIEFAPPASDVPGTVNFTNVTTGVTTTSNLNVGGTLQLGTVEVVATTHTLENTTALGNVTSNTVQFTNATTGIVATGNVEASKFIGDGSLLTGITTIESNVDLIRNTNNTAFINLNSNVVTEFPRSKKLIKYPRVNLTGASSGGYSVNQSTTHSTNYGWYAFNGDPGNFWHTTYGSSLWNSSGNYVGSVELIAGHKGDWITLQLPTNEKLQLHGIRVFPRGLRTTYSAGQAPKDVVVIGSDNGSSWNVIASTTLTNYLFGTNPSTSSPDGEEYIPAEFYFQANKYYPHIGIIIKSIYTGGHANPSISQLEFLGVPEYDPEAHGTDVTVKSVANVPNTDWLDIYIDGQDYSTMPTGAGSVLDKSTNNRHGTPSNVTFNSTWKAFEIESASTSNITVPFNSTGGAYVHTIALWFWMDTTASDPTRGDSDRCLFTIRGSESTGRQIALIVNQDDTNVGFKYDFYSADVRYHDPSVVANKWMHVALTYSGGNNSVTSKEIFLNGVKLGVTAQNSNPLNLTGTENLIIGGDLNSGNVSFEGMVANFRMFNRVLSKDEIYQLYAYQKEYFGLGDLSMTLKAGRLGIGTSEPRAALDVRGNIYAPGVSIQTVAENVHDIVTYPSATSRTISPLTIRITPKFATSKILLQWMINIELGENNLFSIYRNGIKTGYNTSVPDNIWVGAMSAAYDLNVDSTPENMYLAWIDTPNTTGVLEYTIVVRSASTSSYPVYFNRPATGAAVGQTNREITVSFKCATEIA